MADKMLKEVWWAGCDWGITIGLLMSMGGIVVALWLVQYTR